MKDGETDKTKGTRIDGPDFSDEVDVSLLVGGSTAYVAIAGSASGNPIPTTFSWETDVEDVASVDNGVISGHLKGEATVTMTVDGRGIEVTFNVIVHEVVKGIVASTGDDTRLAVGDAIMVSAVAYDAAQDADMAGAEGDEVPNITFSWMSSNTAVATVDEDGVVTAAGAGSADITAHVGDVTSNKIKVTVFDVQSIERRLIATLPVTGTFVAATDSTTNDLTETPVEYQVAGTAALVPATLPITVTVEQYNASDDEWTGVAADAAMVKFVSLDTDVLTLGTTGVTIATVTDGIATANLAADTSGNGQVVDQGTARVEISTKYADTIYIEVDITLPDTGKHGE